MMMTVTAKYIGLRLLLLAATNCYCGGERASPTNGQTSNDKKKKRHGAKNTRSSASWKDTELQCVLSTF